MSEIDLEQKSIASQKPTNVTAKSFSISSSSEDFSQYGNTIKSFTTAGLSYQPIVNVAHAKGHPVNETLTEASLQTEMPINTGQVIEDESRIRAFQNRGEFITVTQRLSSPSVSSKEISTPSTSNPWVRPLTPEELKNAT